MHGIVGRAGPSMPPRDRMNKPVSSRTAGARATVARAAQPSEAGRGGLRWWQRAVVYEIAVISFQDSNHDGKGDLKGLLDRIDHLAWLGVDAVWLTPIYAS